MTILYAYNPHSEGARALSKALGIKRLRHRENGFQPPKNSLIINWGASPGKLLHKLEDHENWLNKPEAVALATDKLKFFETVKDKPWCPWFTTDKEEAVERMRKKGDTIVCRTILNGHSGAGIVIANEEAKLVDAPLYVKYINKKDEYRVHCGRKKDGETTVIDVQRKARKLDVPNEQVNWQIRNHANGFVFAREGINPPDCIIEAARECFAQTNLDFGAVDVLYNAKNNKAAVLEINTAPGLEGKTVENYAKFFEELING